MSTLDLSKIPPPKVIQEVDYDTILDTTRASFSGRSSNYILDNESDPLALILEEVAYRISLLIQKINNDAAAVMVTHATGSDLDNAGVRFSLQRMEGESDDDFRERIALRLETIVAGSVEWYRQYVIGLQVTEVTGDENVVDNVPTPVVSTVKDAQVDLTPNPSFDTTKPESDSNLPEIPGSINVYVQSAQWLNPLTGLLTQVIPSARMLQTVKNHINAQGQNETDSDRLAASKLRRFLGDTVNVLPASVHPYVFCASVRVAHGLEAVEVLKDVQSKARAFVLENEKVGRRIPLSAFYKVIDTDEITEVILMHPQGNVEPDENAVPVVFAEHDLSVQQYETFTDAASFGRERGLAWTVGGGNLLFRVGAGSQDHQFLQYLRTANRITVTAFDAEGNPMSQSLHTYRVNGELSHQTAAGGSSYYQIGLLGAASLTGLTNGTSYRLKILDSIEVQLAT